jgi:hypothetical protein
MASGTTHEIVEDSSSRPARQDDDLERVASDQLKTNAQGTFHQSKLGFKSRRKHLLSKPDPVYAEAVHQDATTVEYTPEEEVSFCL